MQLDRKIINTIKYPSIFVLLSLTILYKYFIYAPQNKPIAIYWTIQRLYKSVTTLPLHTATKIKFLTIIPHPILLFITDPKHPQSELKPIIVP